MGCTNEKMASAVADPARLPTSAVDMPKDVKLMKMMSRLGTPSSILLQADSTVEAFNEAKHKKNLKVRFLLPNNSGFSNDSARTESITTKNSKRRKKQKGDDVAMRKVVGMLYDKVLRDQELLPFFQGMGLEKLLDKQHGLMTLVFGGSDLMQLDSLVFDLRTMHMHSLVERGLSLDHWDLFIQHFKDTLDELPSIPEETRVNALQWMHGTREAFRPPDAEEMAEYWRRKARQSAGEQRRGCPFG